MQEFYQFLRMNLNMKHFRMPQEGDFVAIQINKQPAMLMRIVRKWMLLV
jgi:hypothetical protein